jgi:hypothetical protein
MPDHHERIDPREFYEEPELPLFQVDNRPESPILLPVPQTPRRHSAAARAFFGLAELLRRTTKFSGDSRR